MAEPPADSCWSGRFRIGEAVQGKHCGREVSGVVVGFEDGRRRRGFPDAWLYLVQQPGGDGPTENSETKLRLVN